MKFNEFVKKVEEVVNVGGIVTFTRSRNGVGFGLIQKSNIDGILIAGSESYLGDGDSAVFEPKLYYTVEDAFRYIWRLNFLDDKYGSCDDYDFRFDKAENLIVDTCYWILK